MKVVILAGGYGTRLSEYTDLIPKPLVEIGNEPIIMHIMRRYAMFGFKDFVIALGFKAEKFRQFFANYKINNSDIKVNLKNGKITISEHNSLDWNVSLIDTGLHTMTGGRIKKLQNELKETFLLTYGDGLSNLNIKELIKFHKKYKKKVTLTAVRPNARFGELVFNKTSITAFDEKPQLTQGWINGGFFVMEPQALEFIKNDNEMFEREPINRIVSENELVGYKHDGFWQCMDTKRDHDRLQKQFLEDPVWLRK